MPGQKETDYEREKARRGIVDQEEESGTQPLAMYLDENFMSYVKEKYFVEDRMVLENETILQMIYALEWYDVPRSAKADLVEFHPYLTEGDHEKLYYIKS